MSEQKENIEKIFREALQSHEVPVGPEVWASIQSSLTGLSAASSATGGSLFLGKAAAVIGFAGLITAATIAEVEYHNSESNSPNEIVVSDNDDKVETSQQAVSFEEERMVAEKSELSIEVSSDKEGSTDQSELKSVAVNSNNEASADKQKSSFEASTFAPESTVETAAQNEVAESSSSNSKEQSSPSKTDSKNEIAEAKSDQTPQSNDEVEEVVQEKTTAYFTHSAEQVITPNGDPYNEYFEVEGYGVRDFILRIMTRGGQLVFESNDISVRWNGIDRFGNPLPSGIYFYEIQAVGDDNLPYLEKNAKGSITIVRN